MAEETAIVETTDATVKATDETKAPDPTVIADMAFDQLKPSREADDADQDDPDDTTELPEGTELVDDDGDFTPSETQTQAVKHLKYTEDELADFTKADYKAAEKAFKVQRDQERRNGQPKASDDGGEAQDQPEGTPELSELKDMEEDWDNFDTIPENVNSLNAHVKAQDGRLVAMEAELNAMRAERSEQAQSNRSEAADTFFDSQDKRTWATTFGEGPTDGFNSHSVEAKNRSKVVSRAGTLMKAAADDGDPQSYEVCLDQALKLLHPTKFTKTPKKKSRSASAAGSAKGSNAGGDTPVADMPLNAITA